MRHEAELRYRERTPPRDVSETPSDRVTVEEMIIWAMENLSKAPPGTDEWESRFRDWYDIMVERTPVHLQWLEEYALCGEKGEMPPLRTQHEDKVTCTMCKMAFGRPEDETVS